MSEVHNDNKEKIQVRDISSFLQMALSFLYLWVFPDYLKLEGGKNSGKGGFHIIML